MPVPGLDPARCLARNRKAARQGRNAVPVRLAAKAPPPIDTNDPATEAALRIVTARGTLPRTEAAAVDRINKVRGDGQPALTAEQVWVVYLEAGNSNFIRKYFMFLSDSTLRNIARRGERSIAFMNSHRTGGLSTDAELPYGRTFAGRFEQSIDPSGRSFSRVLLGVYMLRGEHPNGPNGPSTDSLYNGIKAGTIFDVSLGIMGGEEVCDVCAGPLDETDPDTGEPLCGHYPGTHENMDDDQIAAQLARGVPGGVASFTLEDATAGEVSPVFDGAVPGAGFRKALRAARARHLSASSLAEARRSFGVLAGRRDFDPEPPPDRGRKAPQPRGSAMPPSSRKKTVNRADLERVLGELGIELEDDEGGGAHPARPAAVPAAAAAQEPPAPGPAPQAAAGRPASEADERYLLMQQQVARLEETLTAERTARETESKAQRKATLMAQAVNWADTQVRSCAATPAERKGLIGIYAQAASDDHESPAQVPYFDDADTPKLGTRVEALSALWAKRGRHNFTAEHIAPRDLAAAADGGPAPAPPVFDVALLSGQTRQDPVLAQMLDANAGYHGKVNGVKP
jgi:hypothetical protein